MKRTFALLLAMLMCFSVLVACGKTEDPAATTTAATTAAAGGDATTEGVTETTEPVEELEITVKPEYAGKVINILCRGNWDYNEFWAEEITGEPLNDARYNMAAMLDELMGVTIQIDKNCSGGSSGGSGLGFTTVANSKLAGDHAYDVASIGT